ncbi:c-type cytochrome [Marinicella sp. W31]|uniref:c-type cytochrome n=1 Tax=Marinicella sp. W31 TaxID=3023713 RepID=UPI003757A747
MKRIITVLMLMVTSFAWSGDAERGKSISGTCVACHGVDGNSNVNPVWPKLAGQHAQYMERQLKLFQSGDRQNANMSAMVVGLTEEDMADLSAFYAEQKTSIGAAVPELVELGKTVYRAGLKDRKIPACIACHGPTGQGNPLTGYPVLAGQHAAYTAQRLQAYKNGEVVVEAEGTTGQIMAQVAQYLTEEEIQAVSSYLQGLTKAQ